ncbi:MAG TPA: alpha/beta hydrolase [Gaiellaceae bacterium]|jgi:lipase
MRLHVHEWGNPVGRPVVCLHGVTAAGTRFKRLAEQRLGRFRILSFDLRGHGDSDWEPPWTFETLVDDLVETLDAVGVEKAAFVGHSLGGRLVLELAEVAPERVERAGLLDPAIQILPHVALDQAEGQRHEVVYAALEEAVEERLSWNPQAPRKLVEEAIGEELEKLPDGRLRPKYCRAATVAIYGELAGPPPDPETLTMPTLLLYSPEYGLVRDEQIQLYRDALGDRLTVVEVPGLHIVMWDAFEQTAAALSEFLG